MSHANQSGRNRHDGTGELIAIESVRLDDALRALAPVASPVDAWPQLHAQLRAQSHIDHRSREPARGRHGARRNRWHFALPATIAAALVLALATPMLLRTASTRITHDDTTQIVATGSSARASDVYDAAKDTNLTMAKKIIPENLATLQSRSRDLERWLRDTNGATAPQSALDLAASAEMEDMIGMVDVQLAAPHAANSDVALPLWRHRVALLEDLSVLRYGASVAQFRNGLAAAGDTPNASAIPATWIN